MTTLTAPPFMRPPHPRRWTKAEYHKMWELGWFEDQSIELLDGEIVQMPNPGPAHCVSTDKVAEALEVFFPKARFWVRRQSAIDLGLDVEPQPDVAVVDGPRSAFIAHQPTSALL